MQAAVRYFSRKGNTKKVAQAIGAAIGAEAKSIEEKLDEPVDLLFLGGAIYGGEVAPDLRAYAGELSPDLVKRVAVFSTAAGGEKSAYMLLKETLEQRGLSVHPLPFHCKGKFLFLNAGKPDARDLSNAAAYAKQLVED